MDVDQVRCKARACMYTLVFPVKNIDMEEEKAPSKS